MVERMTVQLAVGGGGVGSKVVSGTVSVAVRCRVSDCEGLRWCLREGLCKWLW